VVLGPGAGGCGDPSPPNIVVVTLDTTRADHLGLYGYFRDTSPRLDEFAAEGLVFDGALAPMAVTLPSHLSLFTAAHPLEHGVLDNHNRGRRWLAPSALRSFPEACREAGYRTAAFVSAAPLRAGSGIERGFETFDEPDARSSQRDGRATTDRAVAWLGADARRPYLLWVHYYDAHWPFGPPRSHRDLFATDADLRAWMQERQVVRGARYEGIRDNDPDETFNLYGAELRFQDEQLGRLLDALRARADWEHTAVLIVGDHGEGLSQHDNAAHGGTWDEQLRVPLVLRVPGASPRRIHQTVSVSDALPTLLGLVSLAGTEEFLAQASGRDVLNGNEDVPVLSQDGSGERKRPGYRHALTTRRWKYFRSEYGRGAARESLYDLERDPFELEDVAGEHPEVLARLREELSKQLASREARGREVGAGEAMLAPTDPEFSEQLRALGYVEEEKRPASPRGRRRLRPRPDPAADAG
jgi:arylsulfatase A-like enzyme